MYIQEMSHGSCKYHPSNAYLQGLTASSARYQKALEAGCIPVVVSDRVTLPFEGTCMQWMIRRRIMRIIMIMMMVVVVVVVMVDCNKHL